VVASLKWDIVGKLRGLIKSWAYTCRGLNLSAKKSLCQADH
jgi:hypothetical protein